VTEAYGIVYHTILEAMPLCGNCHDCPDFGADIEA